MSKLTNWSGLFYMGAGKNIFILPIMLKDDNFTMAWRIIVESYQLVNVGSL